MLQVLTKDQELQIRKKNFVKIQPGTLIYFSTIREKIIIINRYCIAVRKVNPKTWQVIELTKENTERLMARQNPIFSKIALKNMRCLNVVELINDYRSPAK